MMQYTIDETIERLHAFTRTGVLTLDGDTEGVAQERIAAYAVRHDLSQDEMAQSLFFPATAEDRKRRRDVTEIVNRWLRGGRSKAEEAAHQAAIAADPLAQAIMAKAASR